MSRETCPSRRGFLKRLGLCSAAALAGSRLAARDAAPEADAAPKADGAPEGAIRVDPKPLFDLSPYLYMQFLEPLGVTDSSIDAAWDFLAERWREDLVEIAQELAPALLRWGGCFASYYR